MTDEPELPIIFGTACGTMGPITMLATAKMRVNFGIPHLLAAARFSRRVGELEGENEGQTFGAFFEEIMACSNACVLSAVAGLESYVNELFADRQQNFPNTTARLSEMIFKLSEQKPINEKFDIALTVLNLQPFDRGRCPAQDVDVLIGLRNAIVHFKPEWDDALVNHGKLSDRLKSKIIGSRFLSDSETLFPRRWMSHSATQWAVTSCVQFLTEFESRTGMRKIGDFNITP